MTRHGLFMIPPLFAYHVVNPRGGAVAVPWYLAGGVSAANCIAAYQPIGADDYADSKINLANPGTYDANDEGTHAPTWDTSYGWAGNGSDNKYLKTGIIVPSSGAYTVICRYSNCVASNDALISADSYESGDRVWGLGFFHVAPTQRWWTGTLNHYGQAITTSGVMALSGLSAYLNGSHLGDSSTLGNIPASEGIKIMKGGYQSYLNGKIQAAAIYNTTLTGDQVSAITTAMEALTSESKAQSLEGLLDFEAEEEKLWWQGADLVEAAAQAIEAPELTWWQKANNVVSDALGKAKKWIDDKLYQLWQAIEDYFGYHEEE